MLHGVCAEAGDVVGGDPAVRGEDGGDRGRCCGNRSGGGPGAPGAVQAARWRGRTRPGEGHHDERRRVHATPGRGRRSHEPIRGTVAAPVRRPARRPSRSVPAPGSPAVGLVWAHGRDRGAGRPPAEPHRGGNRHLAGLRGHVLRWAVRGLLRHPRRQRRLAAGRHPPRHATGRPVHARPRRVQLHPPRAERGPTPRRANWTLATLALGVVFLANQARSGRATTSASRPTPTAACTTR